MIMLYIILLYAKILDGIILHLLYFVATNHTIPAAVLH